ncbi:MAG TPA: sigma-54-dependent Fis family transcriptional regulator [Nitrospirae bacterium]|nr:sigma-54-dependent Fis family transcriptional regulator [Nitrospirota bacterium]
MDKEIRILIVDDEKITLRNLEHILKKEGYTVKTTTSGQNALRLLNREIYDLVLTDLKMERVDGMQILKRTKEISPDTEVIMITGYATVETAIEAMRHGAYHYLTKPFKLEEVRKVIREASEKILLKKENRELRDKLGSISERIMIITQDPMMLRILDTAREIAPTDCNVLITGESGTGKELIARYIHRHSKRASKPFIAVNCGAFNEELLANELFGHEKGAFTGATPLKEGLIEMASGGTLFLDEITEMAPSMQVKLLRVIQEREFYRVGGREPVRVDVRFIAATNRDIQGVLESGELRQDLYYRLNVVTFHLPPLSERKGDIPLLCYHFLRKYTALMGKEVREISEGVINLLSSYTFPGNIRELENIIERAVALCKGESIETAHLPEDLRGFTIRTFRTSDGRIPSLEEHEKNYILWVLNETGGNKSEAARILGIDRVSLWRKLKRFGIED